ncbi:MAG: hypothetical protein HY077_05780 [Elusimicrobia bacterium]|nr:hypothetical protein [Elusimicrobiota bacterium]
MRNAEKIVTGVLVLSLAWGIAAQASAEPSPECQSQAAFNSVGEALTALKKAITENKAVEAIKKDIEKGKTDGRADVIRNGGCLPGTHPSQEGENGIVCRSDKSATVTCLKGHNESSVEGEMGVVTRFKCDKLDPPGGWAGNGQPGGPEAPIQASKKPGKKPKPTYPRPAPEPPQAP